MVNDFSDQSIYDSLNRCTIPMTCPDLLDELVEEHSTLPDDPSSLGFLILAPTEGQAVVHATLFV